MVNFKKTIILKNTKNNGAIGVLKLGGVNENRLNLNLTTAFCDNCTILIKGQKLNSFVLNGKTLDEPIDEQNLDSISCLIIDNLNQTLAYGSNFGNKVICFSLLDEFLATTPPTINPTLENETAKQSSNVKNAAPSNAPDDIETVEGAPLAQEDAFVNKKSFIEGDTAKTDHILQNTLDNTDTKAQSSTLSAECLKMDNAVEIEKEVPYFANSALGDVKYNGDNFYLGVKPQLDEMFICYPEEHTLNSIVPNSKWIKVETQNDFYVVGVISELDEVKYICYGLPGNYSVAPPDEIAGICDWLPKSLDDKFGKAIGLSIKTL